MQMDAGRPTGSPHQGNMLPLVDTFPHLDQLSIQMSIPGYPAPAMIYLDQAAKLRVLFNHADHAGRRCRDRLTPFAGKIQPAMPAGATGKRIPALAEARTHPAVSRYRVSLNLGNFVYMEIQQQRFKGRQRHAVFPCLLRHLGQGQVQIGKAVKGTLKQVGIEPLQWQFIDQIVVLDQPLPHHTQLTELGLQLPQTLTDTAELLLLATLLLLKLLAELSLLLLGVLPLAVQIQYYRQLQ